MLVGASGDGGRSWGAPVGVDDAGGADQDTPQIAVDGRGVVAVTWNDRRDDPEGLCFRARASASLDGGATFLPSVPLAPAPVRSAARPAPWLDCDTEADLAAARRQS